VQKIVASDWSMGKTVELEDVSWKGLKIIYVDLEYKNALIVFFFFK
jgi:hypothetical protein